MTLVPESSGLAIFMMTGDRRTEPITLPLAHVLGVKISGYNPVAVRVVTDSRTHR